MSSKVITRVRAWIGTSNLIEGSRLPPERDLCTTLGVSRAELRKALLVLEVEGSLVREVGRGTYLAKKPKMRKSNAAERTISEMAEHIGPHEAMIARLALEPELARMAALHASPRQLSDLRNLTNRMRVATSWHIYEEMDSEFHDILAVASGNSLLHELHKILNGVRIVVVWRRLDMPELAPAPNYHSFQEHDAIVAALEKRSGNEAFEAMKEHLQSTLSALTANN